MFAGHYILRFAHLGQIGPRHTHLFVHAVLRIDYIYVISNVCGELASNMATKSACKIGIL